MMADTKEAENFYRLLTLVIDVANATLQEKLMCCFPGLSFETILNRKKHNILRLWLPQNRCCCPGGTGSGAGSTGSTISKKSVLHELQCKLMFDYQTASSCSNRNCCCKYVAKTGVDPSVLDAILVTCLLINIANVSAFERSIIEEIRTFRNELQGHRNTARISDVDFNRTWSGLSRAIKGLAASCSSSYNSSVPNEIEKLKSKVLDSSFTQHTQHLIQVMYSNLYQKDEEISEIHTKVDQLLRDNDELTESMKELKFMVTMSKLKDSTVSVVYARGNFNLMSPEPKDKDLQRNPHEDQRKREIDLSTMELDTTLKSSQFIETQAFQFAEEKINNDNLKGPIVFLGLPGDGKTTLALRLAKGLMDGHNFHKTKKQPLIIHGVSECEKVKLIDPNSDLVVFIDDMYGKYSVPRQTEDTWKGCFPHLEACFSDSSSSSCNVLVVAMRKDIYEVCKASFNDLPMFKSSVIIDLTSDDFKLTQEEKMDIFRSYVPLSDIDDNQVQEMCKQSNQIGFPQCCRLYSENKNLQTLKSEILKYPTIHLKHELKKMLKGIDEEKRRFCVLVLIMLHGGCLKVEQCFKNSSSEKETQTLKNAAMLCDLQYSENLGIHLLKDAKSFLGVYVKCNDDGEQYRFSHDSVEQTVVNIMFEKNAHFMIKNSKFENFSQLSSDPLRGPSVFTPEKHHYKIIIERISNEVKDEQYRAFTTLANIDLWNEKEFREQFSESVRLEDVDESTGDNMSLLECGAKTGNYDLVKYMCSTKPKRDILQKALDTAGRFGQEKVFCLLSEQDGIIPNIRTFFSVIESGSMTLFRLLLKSNINFNDTCHLGFPFIPISAFQQISLNGNIEMAREFLSRFPRLFESEHILKSVNMAGYSGSIPFIQYLEDLGADIKQSNVLISASYSGSLDLVRYLIEAGLKTTQIDGDQCTMLNFACLSGNFELVKYIAEKYPFSLHMLGKTGKGDLYFACEGGSVDIVEYLIKNGADVNHVKTDGNTVLHTACLSSKIQVLKYLVENYPHLLHQTNEKLETSLHYACFGGSVDAVRYLIKKGADVNHVATNGRTILHSACFSGKLEIVKYLIENYPYFLHMVDERGETNLHYACNRDSVDVFKYLIKKGANVYHVAADSTTVLHRACFSRKLEIMKYLVENYPDLLHKVNIMGWTSSGHACAGALLMSLYI